MFVHYHHKWGTNPKLKAGAIRALPGRDAHQASECLKPNQTRLSESRNQNDRDSWLKYCRRWIPISRIFENLERLKYHPCGSAASDILSFMKKSGVILSIDYQRLTQARNGSSSTIHSHFYSHFGILRPLNPCKLLLQNIWQRVRESNPSFRKS